MKVLTLHSFQSRLYYTGKGYKSVINYTLGWRMIYTVHYKYGMIYTVYYRYECEVGRLSYNKTPPVNMYR